MCCVSYHHPEIQDVCVQEVINILINKITYYSMYVAMVVSGGVVSAACTVLKLNFNWGRMNVCYGHMCVESYVVDEIKIMIFIFLDCSWMTVLCYWKHWICICWFYSHSAMFSLYELCIICEKVCENKHSSWVRQSKYEILAHYLKNNFCLYTICAKSLFLIVRL